MSKLALITGATSGIGAAFAAKYARMGYDLILTGRRTEIIRKLADELTEKYNVKIDVKIIELSDLSEVDSFIDEIKERNINVLINNAGFGTYKLFHEEDFAGQQNMIHTHIITAVKLVHALTPYMIEAGEGVIINVSSLSAFAHSPRTAVYGSTKSFLNTFTDSINLYLADKGIKIQALCPGLTKCDFHVKMGLFEKSEMKNNRVLKWVSAEEVVEKSLKRLGKGKVIYIPGFWNKVIARFPKIAPD